MQLIENSGRATLMSSGIPHALEEGLRVATETRKENDQKQSLTIFNRGTKEYKSSQCCEYGQSNQRNSRSGRPGRDHGGDWYDQTKLPFLIDLSKDQRKGMSKLGNKTHGFVRKA